MILADTSVWINHFRARDELLVDQLASTQIVTHPFVIGEIAMGSLANRNQVIGLLRALPATTAATHDEVLHFADHHRLYGLGIGLVDAHLLASCLLAPGTRLWAHDKRLSGVASRMGLAFQLVN